MLLKAEHLQHSIAAQQHLQQEHASLILKTEYAGCAKLAKVIHGVMSNVSRIYMVK